MSASPRNPANTSAACDRKRSRRRLGPSAQPDQAPLRLYDELAPYWPLLSSPDDYAREAGLLIRLLRSLLPALPRGQRHCLLELGSGSGHNLFHLRKAFHVTGVDLSPAMLENSRRLNPGPGVEHVAADMRSLRLGRQFHAVLIHDAIDYLTSPADVLATLRAAAEHLLPGGILLLGPTYLRETFPAPPGRGRSPRDQPPAVSADHHFTADQQVAFISQVRAGPSAASFELAMLLLIREQGQLRLEQERHTCGLFARKQWQSWIRQAGLKLQANPPQAQQLPWELFLGRKPAPGAA